MANIVSLDGIAVLRYRRTLRARRVEVSLVRESVDSNQFWLYIDNDSHSVGLLSPAQVQAQMAHCDKLGYVLEVTSRF